MSCIGTAGHVDHGKSTLVKVLTGIDPDRLAEEKERGMTIDLGFAWLRLPGGDEVSIVDVPGHEAFIKNMLAGVGGIDAALFVIAADEGIMPQTREHLAILDLLQVRSGVVALTKADLVDAEWLDFVRAEVEQYLRPTSLAGSAVIPVSAYTGQGLPDLLAELERILHVRQLHQNTARPRLSIDRVFSLSGFGTVVTGTLLDGTFQVGQEVEILPTQLKTRIRGLQTHKQSLESAYPGTRVAINLAGLARSELARGHTVTLPQQMSSSLLVDAHVSVWSESTAILGHNMPVMFYSGAQEIPARVRLLDADALLPGESAWAQLRLDAPAVVARHDRFVLRIASPPQTIGGGEVVESAARYHRRHQPAVLALLERLLHGAPDELILAVLDQRNTLRGSTSNSGGRVALLLEDIVKLSRLDQNVTQEALETLLREGRVVQIGPMWLARTTWSALSAEAVQVVQTYHQQYPLRIGMPKEEWRARLHLPPKWLPDVLSALLAQKSLEIVERDMSDDVWGLLQTRGGSFMRLPGFLPRFLPTQQQQIEQLLQLFQVQRLAPPGRSEAEALVGSEVVYALIEQGTLLKLGDELLFLPEVYIDMLKKIVHYLREHATMTVADARDATGTTRKYILPLLEQMDVLHITRRVGDERVLGTAQLERYLS